MTSAISVKKIKHLNGTNALTVNTAGVITLDQKLVSASTDSSTFAGKIMANAGITAYGSQAKGEAAPLMLVDNQNNRASIGMSNAGHTNISNYNNGDVYFMTDSGNVNLRLYHTGLLHGTSEGGSYGRVNFTQGSIKSWSSVNQTGTQAIEDSYNVSSISDGGVGITTNSFTNNMNNANYSVTLAQQDGGAYNDAASTHTDNADPYSTSQIGYYCHFATAPNDANTAWCQVAGDLA